MYMLVAVASIVVEGGYLQQLCTHVGVVKVHAVKVQNSIPAVLHGLIYKYTCVIICTCTRPSWAIAVCT